MAVTKQTYTAVATWNAGSLADIVRSAFIGAGLMVDWYDSFLSGTIENRILRVVNDASKTYGTVYYWFMFTTGGVFVHTALSWDAVTHVPTGTAYQDYFAITTNATTNHATIISLANTTDVTITRYTSAINSSVTFFLIRNGSTSASFFVSSAGFNANASVNQNIVAFNGLYTVSTGNNSYASSMTFAQTTGLRRTFYGATALRGTTNASSFRATFGGMVYGAIGANTAGGNFGYINSLITAFTHTHTGIASDYVPIYTSFALDMYMNQMPADFGLTSYYASNIMSPQDALVVTPGTEEWEMITISYNVNSTGARLLLLARVI